MHEEYPDENELNTIRTWDVSSDVMGLLDFIEEIWWNSEDGVDKIRDLVAGTFTGVCARNIHQVASKTEYKPGKIRSQAGGFVWEFPGGSQ